MQAIALSDFVGSWRLERWIRDFGGGPDGRFDGEAQFAPAEGGLLYTEDGRMTLEGQATIRATRRYFWRNGGDGRIEIAFENGRPFHGFVPIGSAEAEHWCDPDLYRVSYAFGDWPEWQSEWSVKGPRKDYRLLSRYRRAP